MSSVIQFDIWAAIKLQKHQLPIVNKILLAITRSANGGLIWILTGLGVLAGFREKHLGILFFCVLIFTAVINNLILKSIFMRKRPCDLFQRIPVQIKRPCGSSFHRDIQQFLLRAQPLYVQFICRSELRRFVWRQ